jgi:hypothetical protein
MAKRNPPRDAVELTTVTARSWITPQSATMPPPESAPSLLKI